MCCSKCYGYKGMVDDTRCKQQAIASWNQYTEKSTPQRWVSVTEALPENGLKVLVCLDDVNVMEGCYGNMWYCNAVWNIEKVYDCKVTHWMLMPEPPKTESVGEITIAYDEKDKRICALEWALKTIRFSIKKGAKFKARYDVDYQFMCRTCSYGTADDYIRDERCLDCMCNDFNEWQFDCEKYVAERNGE